ncbi:MAG: hypothetical protein JXR10_13205 [Cyclobacteriaceae bacterium]
MDYFEKQNIEFFKFLDETFGISKAKSWKEISQGITRFKVKRTYRVFAQLFPRKYDYISDLRNSPKSFRTIHYGKLKGNLIIDEIVRYSLYCDEIIVFHPLQNPVVINQQISPAKNPDYWFPDFIEALYFYIVIQKWVKAGIVKLIINPTEYDLDLRDEIDKKIDIRMKSGGIPNKEKYFDTIMDHTAEQFAQVYQKRDFNFIKQSLLEMATPRFSESEAENFALKIQQAISRINPLYKNLNIPLGRSSINPLKGGGPVESILLISELTNSNIYTPDLITWDQLKELNKVDIWEKINFSFSKVPLQFLNSVDTAFALEIRKQERLVGVRNELKRVFGELKATNPDDISEAKLKDLFDSFNEEIRKSEAEWLSIKKEAATARAYWTATSIGIPAVTNELSLFPILAASTGLYWWKRLKDEANKTDHYRIKNPVSVFVDLKNQKQGFFSELKNCIL